MKKINRDCIRRLYKTTNLKIIKDMENKETLKSNHGLSSAVITLYLFLVRLSTEVFGMGVIEDFSRNSIIDDMLSVMPWVDKVTMYRAFEILFELGWIQFGIDQSTYPLLDQQKDYASVQELVNTSILDNPNILIIPNVADGFDKGSNGWLYIQDFFFTRTFDELSSPAKKLYLYAYQLIGNGEEFENGDHSSPISSKSKKSKTKHIYNKKRSKFEKNTINTERTISFKKITEIFLGTIGFATKYKVYDALKELRTKKILYIIDYDRKEQIDNKVFKLRLMEINNSKPKNEYLVDYKYRHKRKFEIIRDIIFKALQPEEHHQLLNYLNDNQLSYMIKALFRKKIKTIESVMLRYIDRLKEGVYSNHNTYRYLQSLCKSYS